MTTEWVNKYNSFDWFEGEEGLESEVGYTSYKLHKTIFLKMTGLISRPRRCGCGSPPSCAARAFALPQPASGEQSTSFQSKDSFARGLIIEYFVVIEIKETIE